MAGLAASATVAGPSVVRPPVVGRAVLPVAASYAVAGVVGLAPVVAPAPVVTVAVGPDAVGRPGGVVVAGEVGTRPLVTVADAARRPTDTPLVLEVETGPVVALGGLDVATITAPVHDVEADAVAMDVDAAVPIQGVGLAANDEVTDVVVRTTGPVPSAATDVAASVVVVVPARACP